MKKIARLVALVLALCMVLTLGLTACEKDCGVGKHTDANHDGKCDVCKRPASFKHVDADGDKKCDVCKKAFTYTMNDYIGTTPSNWNELSSTDSNDGAIMDYLGSAFFTYDFKFDGDKRNPDGSINADAIVDGDFVVSYQAATALTDVTEEFGSTWGLTQKQIQAGGYIWKITLRDDLKWDDGTAIKAEDFVYTMEQQLNPIFQFERASEYYNNAVKIHNAKNFLYQGQSGWFDNYMNFTRDQLVKGDGDVYTLNGNPVVIPLRERLQWLGGTLTQAIGVYGGEYLDQEAFDELAKLADSNGRVQVTDESLAWLEQLITTYPAWDETEEEVVQYMYYNYTFPAMTFDKVGIFAQGDLDLVVVCDNPMELLKEDGSLSYLAAYNFSSLPLVKKSLFEANKKEPQTGSTLWTSTYNTAIENTASWGPFKLTSFQRGKQFVLTRNDNWFGYNMEENKGLYPVDRIVTQVINTEAAAQMAFWAGEVDSLGISVTIANDYKNSPYAIFSPRIATFGIQVLGNLEALKNSGRNNGILAIKEFRQAMSLSLDRVEYNRRLSTANQACLGLMGEDYYYDVENGGVYRFSEQGKAALLRTYGFEQDASTGKWKDSATGREFADIDDAVDAMTGVNMALAKEKANEAFDILTADAAHYGYDSSKKIQIQFGASEPSEGADRTLTFLQEWITNLVSGTKLQGKVEVVMRTDLGEEWAEKFQQGEYELSTSGIGNAPYDPFYLMAAHLGNLPEGASVSYHLYWDITEEELTFTIPSVDGEYDKKGEEVTMTLDDWYYCLNGAPGALYNWGAGFAPAEVRLEILAKLEEIVLGQYYTLPTSRGMSSALGSAKWSYITKTYNPMLGFGGMKYMTFNFADDEWAAFVAERGGDLRNFYKG